MDWHGFKDEYHKYMCLKEIGSCVQNMIIILGSILNIIGGGRGLKIMKCFRAGLRLNFWVQETRGSKDPSIPWQTLLLNGRLDLSLEFIFSNEDDI